MIYSKEPLPLATFIIEQIGSKRLSYIKRKVKDVIGVDVEVVSLSTFIRHFKRHNLPLVGLFQRKLSVIEQIVVVVVPVPPKVGLFRVLISFIISPKQNRYISGFFEPRTGVTVVTLLCHFDGRKPLDINQLPETTYPLLYRVIFHELAHYGFHRSNVFRRATYRYLYEFYVDYFSHMLDKSYAERIASIYLELAENESNESVHKQFLQKFRSILREASSAKKITDVELLRHTVSAMTALYTMSDDKLPTYLLRLPIQHSFRETYGKRGITSNALRSTIFGQELLSPSEVISVTVDSIILKNDVSIEFSKILLTTLSV